MLSQTEEDLVITAQVVHEAIRAYQTALGEAAAPPWEKAEDWQREATIAGIKFRLENPDAPSSAQHEQWMQEKRDSGWVFGAVKDAEKKTHPMMIPYQELPLTEKRKDYLFSAVVSALSRGT